MEAIAAAPSRARVLRAFQSRDFRLLWTGQARLYAHRLRGLLGLVLTRFGLLPAGAVSALAAPGTIIALGACVSMCIIASGLSSRQIRTID